MTLLALRPTYEPVPTTTSALDPGHGHQTLSDPAHLAAAVKLRHDRAEIGAANRRDHGEVQLRCLADYDTAFGLDDGTEGVA